MPPKPGKKKAQRRLGRKGLDTFRGGLQAPVTLPKPGDVVLIAFDSGTPSFPAIPGSLFTPSQPPPVQRTS
jgi:hypothetical protein